MKTSDDQLATLLDAVAGYFAVLAEPTRLRVLRALCRGERTVGRIVEETGVSQPTASRHLAALHRHGIVARRRDANLVYYRVSDATTPKLCRSVCSRVARAMVGRSRLRRRLRMTFGQDSG
ncbi:MAG TPA: metalloregulator ArsR/SmtB family transcription factor [Steroidobacteraceae bacterium]|nr:metalloregulator ArsR/SmtB family transcription factor [Steroidobacteraceae bacterium]